MIILTFVIFNTLFGNAMEVNKCPTFFVFWTSTLSRIAL